MDDDVIDLTKYLDRSNAVSDIGVDADESRGSFSVWGGDGDRSRFALPVWRSVYLVGGARGGLVWEDVDEAPGVLTSFFVLDLAAEPARVEFSYDLVADLETSEAPSVLENSTGIGIFLGVREGRKWYMVLDERGPNGEALQGGGREDLLFLAGECAGLLFYREIGLDKD
ncbi:MAG: hypothetical protein BMS9Abin29_0676 [Gemmatimonadota bacterium]|nr:MAG: hypothetical protein BMS9Abin29_0676 [Gemmatimonadota bacterium]